MSWDHQENHDDARSARAVRYISGSMSWGDDVEDEDEDDDDRRRLGGRQRRGGDDDGSVVRGNDDDDDDDDDDDGGGGGGGSRRLRWRWATTNAAAEAEEAGCWNDSTTHAPSNAAMNDDSAMMSDVKCLRCDIVI